MTVLKTHALTGTASTTVTTGTEGFNSVTGTLTYTTLTGSTGGTGVLVATGSTSFGEDSATTNTHVAFYIQLPTLPTGDMVVIASLATSTSVSYIGVLSTGALRIYSSSGTTVATTTTLLSTATWYRIEYNVIATGQEMRLFTASGSTAVETLTGGINGSTAPNKWRIGHPQSTKTAGDVYLDQYTLHDTWPNLGNTPPVASFIYSASALVLSVDASASTDPDGTIASYDYDWGDSTTHGTSSVTTHTYASSGTYTVNLTVTDNLGATHSVSHSVSVSSGGATVVEVHPHDGTVGATPTTSGEGYNVISGTQVYVAGGISGSPTCSIRYATGDVAYAEDSSVSNTFVAFWVRAPSLPTGDVVIAAALGGGTTMAAVGLLSTGAVRIYSSTGTTQATTTATLTANTWYRIEWNVEITGQTMRLYPAASGTLTESKTGSVTSGGGGGGVDTWRFGHPQTARVAGTIDLDRVTRVDGGWPGIVNANPVAVFTHSETGLATSVNGGGSTDDIDITSYDWNWGDATGHGSGVTASHTYSTAGTYTITLTVTDGFGATGTTSTGVTVTSSTSSIVRVHPHDGTAGNTATASPENYSSVSGTMTYVTGGITNNSALRSASGATAYGEDSATTNLYVAIYVRCVTLPTGDMVFAAALNGASSVAYLGLLSTGAIRIYSSAGTTANTTTATLTANTWYRLEWNVSASGQEIRLYTASGSTLTESKTGVVAVALDPNKWRFGHPQTAKVAGDVDLDQITQVSGGWPDLFNNAPVAAFTKSISGLTVSVNGSTSTDDIGIASYDWNWGDSTTHGTGVTSSHAYASAGTRTLTLTVTDVYGLTNATNQSTTVALSTFAIRIQPGDLPAHVRGVIVSGTEAPARLREVVGNTVAPEDGTPIPRTIPFTIGT